MAAPSAPTVALGINGFGRIGRLVLRAALQSSGITPVAINDPLLDAHQALYLFTHDSVHGRFRGSGACGRLLAVADSWAHPRRGFAHGASARSEHVR